MINKLAYKLCILLIKIFVIKGVRIKVKGKDNLPDGGLIIASNHVQVSDSVIIASVLNKPVHFFIAKWVYKKRLCSSFFGRLIENCFGGSFLGFALKILGQIPVEKGNKRLNKNAFIKSRMYIKIGEYVGIYPRGEFEIKRGKKPMIGVAKLSIENVVPVVPIHLFYPFIVNRESLKPNCKKMKVVVGKPIYPTSFKKIKNKKNRDRYMANYIMKKIDTLK